MERAVPPEPLSEPPEPSNEAWTEDTLDIDLGDGRTSRSAPSQPALAGPASPPGPNGPIWAESRAHPAIAAPLSPPDVPEDQPHWFVLLLRELVETFALALVLFLVIRVGIQSYRIEGQSMEPNFHNGEYLLVNKLAYRLGEYERGDVIVFRYPNDPSKDYIKRIIGLPGDTVEIRDQQVYINGVPLQEPYPTRPIPPRNEPPVTVRPGTLYVLGDNRPASSDSRSWGLLDQKFVIGKAWIAIWPIQAWEIIDHPPLVVQPQTAQGP